MVIIMGKNGDRIRAKKQQAVQMYTRAQMEQHDKMVRKEYEKECMKKMEEYLLRRKEEINAEIDKEWKQREIDFAGPNSNDRFMNMLSYMLAVTCRVLVRDFGWKPLDKVHRPHPNHRLSRFSVAVAEEIDQICEDQTKDVRRYCDQVYEECGVRFSWTDAK